jgi:predicted dehydrogenase
MAEAARISPSPVIRRALFVGLGSVGQRHLRNVRALLGDSVAVDAFRVRREQAVLDDFQQVVPGASLESRYGVEAFTDFDRALAREPDVVFITNPSSLHVPIASKAAEAGAHLFIEKPLSHSLEGVDELCALTEQRGLVAFVAYQLRRHPGFARLKQRLEQGSVGRPLSVRAEVGEYLPGFHPYEDYRRMYASQRALGGGVTLSQIHELDYLIALFGRPRRAFSMGGKVSELEVDVDDLSSSLVEFRRPDGGRLIAELHQDFFQRPTSRSCVVIGESGRLEWNLSERRFRHWDASSSLVEEEDYSAFPRNQAFVEELEHFLGCIARRSRPDIGLREGAQSLELALGLLRSQETGLPVDFQEKASS